MVLKIVRRGSLFVDVGAYIGGYSIRACRNGARVIAIEPDKENFKLLQRNLNINNCDAYAFNVAAGSREGVAPFYASAEGYSPDRYSLTSGVGKFIVDYVKVLPIDQILSTFENNTSKVDLVKIDVEGFENDVLIGMRDSFKKIRYIMVEVMPETMKPCLHTLKEGFKIIDMCKHSGEDMVWYNVLLRHK